MFFNIFILLSNLIVEARWTEADEDQRIAMIKEMDLKAFEDEIRKQQIIRRQQAYRHDPGSSVARSFPKMESQKMEKTYKSSSYQAETGDESDNWCYHCTSPIGHLSEPMKRTIKDFLKLRRTSYPLEVSTKECINAKNFTLLHKQKCKHRYCQTMSIVDHDEAASFVLRGCAENFGAIDTKTLDAQRENACTKLHDKVDISECICKERKYCYANEKKLSGGTSLWPPFLLFFLVFLN